MFISSIYTTDLLDISVRYKYCTAVVAMELENGGWRPLHHLHQIHVDHLFVTSIVAASNGVVAVSTLTPKING
ncbi:hypothetical protein L6452_29267 [Arctium lappa]|uniref:Uncharacterized protein n=1 Tax=Arctium lappa TaxID=4217 RepID=A0ACB8ZGP9_ARCLA|nr:hypothetical protein L6452_29267 [Arctium lappa]